MRESREFSFYAAGAPFATFARATGTGLGNRVCFTHALGEAGLAGAPADLEAVVGDIESARGALRKACFTRRAAAKSAGDYHGNFAHAAFMKWRAKPIHCVGQGRVPAPFARRQRRSGTKTCADAGQCAVPCGLHGERA